MGQEVRLGEQFKVLKTIFQNRQTPKDIRFTAYCLSGLELLFAKWNYNTVYTEMNYTPSPTLTLNFRFLVPEHMIALNQWLYRGH